MGSFSLKYFFLFLLAFPFLKLAANIPLYDPIGETIGDEAYRLELDYRSFKTATRIDTLGVESPLIASESYSQTDIKAETRYGVNASLEARAGLFYRLNNQNNMSGNNLKVSGVESFWGGIKYSFRSKSEWSYALDMSIRNSAYSTSTYSTGAAPSNEIILGDAGMEMKGGFLFSYKKSQDSLFEAQFQYVLPPNGLSPEIESIGSYTYRGKSWFFQLTGAYIYSMNKDIYGDTPYKKPSQSRGITYLYNSINRSYMSGKASLGKALGERVRVVAYVGQRVSGLSTDLGTYYGLGLTFGNQKTRSREDELKAFRSYDIDATVIKVSPRGVFVKIDKGLENSLENGMRMDIYRMNYFGQNKLIVAGKIHEVGSSWAIIKLLRKYENIAVKNGDIARGRFQ